MKERKKKFDYKFNVDGDQTEEITMVGEGKIWKEQRVALIFGVNGQDGSYLSELLLEKGYRVVGVVRRSSTDNKKRLSFSLSNPNFKLVEGDVTDSFCVSNLIEKNRVDEVYNLAAQSHVGTSFSQPGYTWDVNAKGPLNILEAIRHSSRKSEIKFYQASTSEMFGKNFTTGECEGVEVDLKNIYEGLGIKRFERKFQDEETPFAPQSPYAIAKLAAHHLCRNYRDSYGIFACSGILFNHECLSSYMPILYKNSSNIIKIDCISDFFDEYVSGSESEVEDGLMIWDKDGWTRIKYASSFKHDIENNNKGLRIVNSRNSVYAVTNDHVCILDDDSESPSKDLLVGDRVKIIEYPDKEVLISSDENFCELLGMMVGDGHFNGSHAQFTNKDPAVRERFKHLWEEFGGSCRYYESTSGFTGEVVGRLDLSGVSTVLCDFCLYTNLTDVFGHRYKKVPYEVLNAKVDCMEAFLVGYNACDGLKKNPCTYRFKNFKTNSATLASGLLYLVSKVTGQKYNITVEESWEHGKQQFYYSINLLSDRESSASKYEKVKNMLDRSVSQRQIHRETGISRAFIRKVKNGYIPNNTHHLELPSNEIKKIIDIPNYDGWFFDLETQSGTFHAGVGQGVVHNSPRRGEQFVTRKITKWIGEFKRWSIENKANRYDIKSDENNIVGYHHTIIDSKKVDVLYPKLRLGNLDAKRDWGFAGDYVEAMWLMLQQDKPDDFVVATGETYSVRDFLDAAFKQIGIEDWSDYVVIDPEFYRPAEVDYLLGDPSKAKRVLGWEPKTTFSELVKLMVREDTKDA